MFRTKAQHTACNTCPIAKTADLIGDSTVLLIIRDLSISSRRFGEFQTSLPSVSTRTLTEKLKKLEGEDIVSKQKYAEFPPRVEYSLTKKGKGLLGVIRSMEKYGKNFLN